MEHGPSSDSYSHTDSQQISSLILNVKVRYCVYKNPPLVHTLSQMSPLTHFRP